MVRVGCFFQWNLFTPKIYNDISEAILGVSHLLPARGFELVKESTDVDVLWIDRERYEKFIGIPDKPIILDEVTDVCQVYPETRKLLRSEPNVIAVTKPHAYRPRYRYDLKSPELYEIEPEPCISRQSDFVFSTIGYGALFRLEPLRQMTLDPILPRPIDVFFCGTVEYDLPAVKQHRLACCDAIETACRNLDLMCEVIRGRELSTFDYWARLRQSKVCVSPWGWGAACHRDAEAILCGCSIIKPSCSWVETYPDIYTPDLYRVCDQDWSDLEEQIKFAVNEFEYMRKRREHIRNELINATTPDAIADRIAGVLKTITEGKI